MRRIVTFPGVLLLLCLLTVKLQASPADLLTQDDTVIVEEIAVPPVFDGLGTDDCWQGKTWQVIDQVWIPWGTTMDPADFSGRYKVVWSRAENLLYFLLEITDDVESDAYQHDGSTADIYNFDMFEVFIDEDKSGGPHVFSTPENAFAYHTFTKFPADGETTTTFVCDDMGSDYRSHFPSFILRKEGNVATWEFSLIVYNDTYTASDPAAARAVLTDDKIIGLSIAYNDDDEPEVDPALTQRDNFIGSVAVSEAAYNNHWMNADDFGTLKIVGGDINPAITYGQDADQPLSLFPNPVQGSFTLSLENDYRGNVTVQIFDTDGKELSRHQGMKTRQDFSSLYTAPQQAGLYMVRILCGKDSYTGRISVTE